MPRPRKTDLSLSAQLQSFAEQQLANALGYLTDDKKNVDTAIHETRRCLKRLRALLRLVKAALPPEIFVRDNAYFRDAAHRLSELRDTAARREALILLQKEFSAQLPASVWREAKRALARSKTSRAKRNVMCAIAMSLNEAAGNLADWALDFEDTEIVQQGMRKIFKQGKHKMETALYSVTAESYHEWRKSVNHLRHQLRLLQELKIISAKEYLQTTKMLAQVLGLNNDLDLLAQYLSTANLKITKQERQILQDLIQTRRENCEKGANKIGAWIYQTKPKTFLAKIWH